MLDIAITGGYVVDGTGAPRRRADVGIVDGTIVTIGTLDDQATTVIDATDQIVSPGFVDVHTHLDVQGFWDTTLSPSPLHGVTTVLGGNCGFTVAPLTDDSAGYLMRMLARVEGMPLESLEVGVPWNWRTTGEFLDRLDGRLAVNAGFMVGHSALRRVVMGEAASERTATADELTAMQRLLRDGLAAGGLGFSSSWAATHNDAEGRPVPSRHASAEELIALASVCREFEGTSLEFLPKAAGPFDEAAADVMIQMTVAAQRPLNWNIMSVTASTLPAWLAKLEVGTRARAAGGKVVGLVIPATPSARLNFRTAFVLDSIPGWEGPMFLPPAEKLRYLADPVGRTQLRDSAAGDHPMRGLANWAAMRILDCFTPQTKQYEGRLVSEIATAEGKEPFDALLDIVIADGLLTSFTPARPPDSEADWEARAQVFRDPRAVIGASDAGAHLDLLATFNFSTVLLAEAVRKQRVLELEEAVRLITQVPAELYGLRRRGTLAVGSAADVVVFDEATIDTQTVSTRVDLPAGIGRLYAEADGIGHVIVNGVEIARHGVFTEHRPGTLLRSGRDTYNPSLN